MPPHKSWSKVLVLIGSVGPLGYFPASGTVTVALLGPVVYWMLYPVIPWVQLTIALVFAGLSVWIHDIGDRILGEKDSRRLVWDELAGFLFAILCIKQFTWQIALIAIFLERVIDILKIPPANWIEDHWPGGWGVVGDDVVAGLYTCALVHALMYLVPQWLGLPA